MKDLLLFLQNLGAKLSNNKVNSKTVHSFDKKSDTYMQSLEQRVVFDVAGADTLDSIETNTDHLDEIYKEINDEKPKADFDQMLDEVVKTSDPVNEVIILDSNIDNVDILIASLGDRANILVLDPINGNGISQITDYLDGKANIKAIHIISHGSEGELKLDGTSLNAGNLQDYSEDLLLWTKALSADVDILLYGCDIASGESGANFIRQLAALTKSDVAASKDKTGNKDKGGDWVLEYTHGIVETDEIFDEDVAGFGGILSNDQSIDLKVDTDAKTYRDDPNSSILHAEEILNSTIQDAKNIVHSQNNHFDAKYRDWDHWIPPTVFGTDRAVKIIQVQEGQEITFIHGKDYLTQSEIHAKNNIYPGHAALLWTNGHGTDEMNMIHWISPSYADGPGDLKQHGHSGDVLGTKTSNGDRFTIVINNDALGGSESKAGAFAIKNTVRYQNFYHDPGHPDTSAWWEASNEVPPTHRYDDREIDTYSYYVYEIVDNKQAASEVPANVNDVLITNQTIDYNSYINLNKPTFGDIVIDDNSIVFTIKSSSVGGYFEIDGNNLDINDTFTQNDINNNRLKYVITDHTANHNIQYDVEIRNKYNQGEVYSKMFDNEFVLSVDFSAPGIISNQETSILQNTSFTIHYDNLNVSDLQSDGTTSDPADLSYTITNDANLHGQIQVSGAVATTFTQQDINDGKVVYIPAVDYVGASSFVFKVSDAENKKIENQVFAFNILSSSLPQVDINDAVELVEDGNIVISDTYLSASDVKSDGSVSIASEITYTITDNSNLNGVLKLSGNVATTFTQQDINDGNVVYIPNVNYNGAASFVFEISDTDSNKIENQIFNLTINAVDDPTVLVNNDSLAVFQNDIDIKLGASNLLAENPDDVNHNAVYKITNISFLKGELKNSNGVMDIVNNNQFTQSDINNGFVTFTPSAGVSGIALFDFVLTDNTDISYNFVISIESVNTIPVVDINTKLLSPEDTEVIIGSNYLTSSDAETSNVSYEITDLTQLNGILKKDGVLMIEGSEFTQNDLSNNKVTYLPNENYTGNAGFVFSVKDDDGGSITNLNFEIEISGVSDMPIIETNTKITVVENSMFNIIDESYLKASDIEDSSNVMFIVDDVTNLKGQLMKNGIELQANDSFSMQDIIGGNIMYTPEASYNGSAEFTFTVRDTENMAIVGQKFIIDITSVNDLPYVINNTGMTVLEDVSVPQTITDSMLNVSDLESGDDVSFVLTNINNLNGKLLSGGYEMDLAQNNNSFTMDNLKSGFIQYMPDENYSGAADFVFKIVDEDGGEVTGLTFDITVTASNDLPFITNNAGATINEDTAFFITTNILDVSDLDQSVLDDMRFKIDDISNLNGKLELLDGSGSVIKELSIESGANEFKRSDLIETAGESKLKYTPNSNFFGEAEFKFTVIDDQDGMVGDQSFKITVESVNDAPVVLTNITSGNNPITINEDGSMHVIKNTELSINDVEDEDMVLYVVKSTDSLYGSLQKDSVNLQSGDTFTQADIENKKIRYVPELNYNGSASFAFNAQDANGNTLDSDQTFAFSVTSVNDMPEIVQNNKLYMIEDAQDIIITNSFLNVTDFESTAEQLTFTINSLIDINGVLKKDNLALDVDDTFTQADINNNLISYTPISDFNGNAEFAFTVKDSDNNPERSIASQKFTMSVISVNDAPQISTNLLSTNEDTNVTLTSAVLDVSDVEDQGAIKIKITNMDNLNGALVRINSDGNPVILAQNEVITMNNINDNKIEYRPNADFSGHAYFNFTAEDSSGMTIINNQLNIEVVAEDDPGVISQKTLMVTEDSDLVTITNTFLQVTDLESDNPTYTLSNIDSVKGRLFNGTTQLAASDTFFQNDIDNEMISYQPSADENGMASFTFTVAELGSQEQTFNISIMKVNDKPQVTINNGLNVSEDSTDNVITNAMLTSTDTETDVNAPEDIIYKVTNLDNLKGSLTNDGNALALNGTFTQADINDGKVKYAPDANIEGSFSFKFSVLDQDDGAVTEQEFNITVTGVSDPVVFETSVLQIAEGSAEVKITKDLLKATDIETTNVTFKVESLADSNGRLKLNGNTLTENDTFTQADINANRVSYLVNNDYTGSAKVVFTLITDDAADSTGNEFNINVSEVNDMPIMVNNNSLDVIEGQDTAVTITDSILSGSDIETTDPENLTFTITGNSNLKGSVTVDGKGVIANAATIAADPTFTLKDIQDGKVKYTADDGVGAIVSDFEFSFSDANGGTLAGLKFEINIRDFTNSPLTLAEDSEMIISSSNLNADGASIQVKNLDALDGQLFSDGNVIAADDIILMSDIKSNKITFKPNANFPNDGSASDSTTFTFDVVKDGNVIRSDETFTLNVLAINDQPFVNTNSSLNIAEDSNFTVISNANIDVSDIELGDGTSIKVTDVTKLSGTLKINGADYSSGSNDTFTQADIDSGNISFKPDANFSGNASFKFEISDGTTTVSNYTFNIVVSEVDEAAQITINPLNLTEGDTNAVITNSILAATDEENPNVKYTITSLDNLEGTLKKGNTTMKLDSTFTQMDINRGSIKIDLNENANGAMDIKFKISDGTNESDEKTLNIIVDSVNDIPVLLTNKTLSVDEGSVNNVLSVNILASSDIESTDPENLTYTLEDISGLNGQLTKNGIGISVNGTFTQKDVNDGNIKYTSTSLFNGSASFGFKLTDGDGAEVTGLTFDIDVISINANPDITTNTGLTTAEDAIGYITTAELLYNDNLDFANGAGDGDLTYTINNISSLNGSLFKLDGSGNYQKIIAGDVFQKADLENTKDGQAGLKYVPNANFNGNAKFDFTVSDAEGGKIEDQEFAITVTSVNDLPIVSTSLFQTTEDSSPRTITANNISAIDTESSNFAIIVTDVTNLNGTLGIKGVDYTNGSDLSNANFTLVDLKRGLVTYSPDANYNNTSLDYASFNFNVSDGTDVVASSLQIEVASTNDLPVVNTSSATIDEDSGPLTLDSSHLDIVDNDEAVFNYTIRIDRISNLHGSLKQEGDNGALTVLQVGDTFTKSDVDAGKITYTADNNFYTDGFTPANFGFSVIDNNGGTLASQVFDFTINSINDLPYTVTNNLMTINEDSGEHKITTNVFSISDVETGINAVVEIEDLSNFNGKVLNAAGNEMAAGDTFSQRDIMSGNIKIKLDDNVSGLNTFNFKIKDSDNAEAELNSTFSVYANPINDIPSVTQGSALELSVAEDQEIALTDVMMSVTDVETSANDQLFYTIENNTNLNGTLVKRTNADALLTVGSEFTQDDINNGRIIYKGNTNFAGSADFKFSVRDPEFAKSELVDFNITVTGDNDAPYIVANNTLDVFEDIPVTITPKVLDANDVESQNVSYVLIADSANGFDNLNGTLKKDGVILNPGDAFTTSDVNSGAIVYIGDVNFNGSAEFKFKIKDHKGLEVTQDNNGNDLKFQMNVNAINDLPYVVSATQNINVTEDSSLDLNSLFIVNDKDAEQNIGDLKIKITGNTFLNGNIINDGTTLGVGDSFKVSEITNVTYVPDTNYTGPAVIEMVVEDDTGETSGKHNITINVIDVNDPPVVSQSDMITTYTEGDDPIVIKNLLATDVETRITYKITDMGNLSGELIKVRYSGDTTGVTLPVNFEFSQNDINSGLIKYIPSTGFTGGQEYFEFSVTDLDGSSVTGQKFSINIADVFVNAVNIPNASLGNSFTVDNTMLKVDIGFGGANIDGADIEYSFNAPDVAGISFYKDSALQAPGAIFKLTQNDINNGLFAINVSDSSLNFADLVKFDLDVKNVDQSVEADGILQLVAQKLNINIT